MLDLKKIKYSFVLCLALLFSISFAGTLTINDDTYTTNLSYDFTVNSFSDNYFLAYGDVTDVLDGGTAYRLVIYDYEEFLDGLTVLGLWPDINNSNSFYVSNLKPTGQDEYNLCNPYITEITFFPDVVYLVDGSGGNEILPSSESVTINGNDIQRYHNVFTYGPMQIFHSDYDVYTWNTENGINGSLGSLIYDGTSSGGVVLPFSTSRTQQQINDIILSVFKSPDFVANLPENYSDYFVIYDENIDIYDIYFYPKDTSLLGLIHKSNSTTIEGYRIEMTPYGFWNSGDFPIIRFCADDNNVSYIRTLYYSEFSQLFFDYYNQPIVYSSTNIPFKTVLNGSISDYVSFTTSPFTITDDGQDVTADDFLDADKDTNSLWSMIFNIFNPKSNSTSDMASIEKGHEDIMSNADFNNYQGIWLTNNSLLDFSSFVWLTTACELLFMPFAGFLALCCFFITISRILR